MSKTRYNCEDLIVGAGWQGMVAAQACIEAHRDCIIVDKGAGLGGILRPAVFDGLTIDVGCHIWGAGEQQSIDSIQSTLGIPMMSLRGHCERSISPDGVNRPHLSVPSFESEPLSLRREASERARDTDFGAATQLPLGEGLSTILGPEIGGRLLGVARKFYGRDPSRLSFQAARQMAITRVKLHTCDELASLSHQEAELGSFLCSRPLDSKSGQEVKYRYPVGGLGRVVSGMVAWLQSRVQATLAPANPMRLDFDSTSSAGTLETRDTEISFKRLMWCCNPLALGSLLGIPLPARDAVAGSAYRCFFFRLPAGEFPVEYSHDFRLDSPVFRSWMPPQEMQEASPCRFLIVECPGLKETADSIETVRHHAAAIHGLDASLLEFLGSRPQARFFPTVAYENWLRVLPHSIGKRVVRVPDRMLFRKELISEWWRNEAMLN